MLERKASMTRYLGQVHKVSRVTLIGFDLIVGDYEVSDCNTLGSCLSTGAGFSTRDGIVQFQNKQLPRAMCKVMKRDQVKLNSQKPPATAHPFEKSNKA